MSRSGYSDDVDGWQLIQWRGRVASAIRGLRGQELLSGLLTALDAMPVKELIAGDLITESGGVCALGALGVACGRADEMRAVDPEDYERVARFFNVAEALVREVQYLNDEANDYCTPAERWTRMRKWVVENLATEEHP